MIYTEFLHTTAASTHLSCIYCSVRTFFLSSILLCLLGINSSYFYLLPFTALHEKNPRFFYLVCYNIFDECYKISSMTECKVTSQKCYVSGAYTLSIT